MPRNRCPPATEGGIPDAGDFPPIDVVGPGRPHSPKRCLPRFTRGANQNLTSASPAGIHRIVSQPSVVSSWTAGWPDSSSQGSVPDLAVICSCPSRSPPPHTRGKPCFSPVEMGMPSVERSLAVEVVPLDGSTFQNGDHGAGGGVREPSSGQFQCTSAGHHPIWTRAQGAATLAVVPCPQRPRTVSPQRTSGSADREFPRGKSTDVEENIRRTGAMCQTLFAISCLNRSSISKAAFSSPREARPQNGRAGLAKIRMDSVIMLVGIGSLDRGFESSHPLA